MRFNKLVKEAIANNSGTSKIKELLSILSYKQEQAERGVGSSVSAANKAVEDAEQAIIDYVENLNADLEDCKKDLKGAHKDFSRDFTTI